MKVYLLINNQDVETAQYNEVRDPGRLSEIIGEVGKGTVVQVDQAVRAAHHAFLSWRNTPLEERISLVLKVADVLEKESPFLAEIISKQNGMLLEASKVELNMAVSNIRNTASFANVFFEPTDVEDETSWVRIEKKPIGVIAGIVPWNAPIVLTIQKLAPSLIAGNTMVFKPSPFSSMGVTLALKKIAELFPPGVINVVTGDGDIGEALTTHPLVRKISFTGGGPTAKNIMKSAANSLKDVHFELGGNDPAIILNDANLDTIVPDIVNGVFRRSGQFCYAIKRIYIPSKMYNDFYEKMCDITSKYKIGHQLNPDTSFGPVNNHQQYENIKQLVERLKDSQAKLIELGEKLEPDNWKNGYYLKPIIARDVKPDQEIVTCEQFGPIIPLIPYQTEDEVIQMANSTEYGLGSTIWSSDEERALKIAREIESGMTFINTAFHTPLGYKYIPFNGLKQSGIGLENSEMVFSEYIETHGINLLKNK
ncbi:acyl-CoA reductase-like NAD-dependent aldehyde dehydrogenase [Evansella vedderi]|uniref:Acyl-CoA reductase-like NAD-dependent aldehyde dehydrogenase n=1 Tax=Evansella vedderi TaxID=38282 RepID=A0ABU0A1V4_9BACI|nr:aldehyde dehydrogenase family protein [Evansella vedderi]MDQ0257079.1 acyl-CoA reductase-like NAD-dependent aldehyde dehydrogenase [Evansella vedderi]